MTDPPDPENDSDGGPRANEIRPHRDDTRPVKDRSDLQRVPASHADLRPPTHSGADGSPGSSLFDAAKWILLDHGRAAWALAFVVVILAGFVLSVWLVAPHLGSIAGVLSGLGAGAGGGYAVDRVRRSRQQGGEPDQRE